MPVANGSESWPGHLEFVPVELLGQVVISGQQDSDQGDGLHGPAQPLPPLAPDRDERWADRTSLFGEPEA